MSDTSLVPGKAMNPKHIAAMKAGKAPLEYLIPSVNPGEARVLKGGADKYGVRNWLIDKILATTYLAAIRRHLDEWAKGVNVDTDSNEHPLQHVRACCGIIMDADAHGTLIDDRNLVESIDQKSAELVYRDSAESIDQNTQAVDGVLTFDTELAPGTLIEAAETTWMTVTYSTHTFNHEVLTTTTYGPFASYDLAMAFIKLMDGRIPGTVNLNTLNSPSGEIENVRNRDQKIDSGRGHADRNDDNAGRGSASDAEESGGLRSEPNRNETREAFLGRWGKSNPETGE